MIDSVSFFFLTWFLNLVMEEETLLQAGAKHYERTDSRNASRNIGLTHLGFKINIIRHYYYIDALDS